MKEIVKLDTTVCLELLQLDLILEQHMAHVLQESTVLLELQFPQIVLLVPSLL